MSHYRIKNWSHYQSYKDRKPPWIRLHRSLIDNPDFQMMSADSRALLPMLWLLACEDKDPVSGNVRMSYKEIAWRLRIDNKVVENSLKELQVADFIKCIESVTDPLLDSNSDVTPETETETETDIETIFEDFWKIYPSRHPHQNPKKPARQKFELAVKRGVDPQDIIEGARRYASYCRAENTDPKFIAQAVTWLNQERWKESLEIKPKRTLADGQNETDWYGEAH